MKRLGLFMLAALCASAVEARDRRCRPNGSRTQDCDSEPFFSAFPASGTGTSGVCSTTAPTGAKGETLTFARSGVAECYSNDGQTLTQMASGVPRVSSGAANTTRLGLWVEGIAATNSLLQCRDASNAAWTKTNMTCVRNQTGMRSDSNGATRCTATGANATVCQTVTIAAATRTSSGHIRRAVGSGAVSVARDGATYTAITSSLSSTLWRRVVPYDAPGCAGGNCIVVSGMTSGIANPQICIKLATSGDAVDLDFWQDEAGSFASSPIETTGSAVARNAETAYFTVPAFSMRSLSAEFQSNGNPGTSFRSIMAGWQDATHITSLWADSLREPACDFYDGAFHTYTAALFLPSSSSTFTQWGCDHADGATTAVLTQRAFPATSTAATASDAALVTRIYVGGSPLGGTGFMPGVIRGICADPTYGRCSGSLTFTSDGSPILAVGDSITQGVAQIPTQWTLGLNLSQNRAVYTLGNTGISAAQCLADWRAYGRGKGYTTATVLCGVNSLISGDSAASIMPTLATIMDEMRADGIVVHAGTILPWSAYASSSPAKQTETTALNAAILAYCTANSMTCVDFASSALNGGSADLAALYDSGDHIHPNAAGGALMATLWAAVFP